MTQNSRVARNRPSAVASTDPEADAADAPTTLGSIAKYIDNHVVTAGYTRRFVDDDGCVLRIDLTKQVSEEAKRRTPETVGYRPRYFADREIARRAEQRLSVIEGKGLEVLNRLDEVWPLEGKGTIKPRWYLARLVAVHMVRNPGFWDKMAQSASISLAQRLPEYKLDATQERELLHVLTSEAFAVNHMFSMIAKSASMIASAHWTVIEFEDRLLATSDQPVTAVPLLDDGATTPVDPQPPRGLLNTEEFRFPIDPHRALLFTWANEPDTPEPIHGDDDIAANLNRSVIGQAEQEWFHHPARRPTRLPSSGIYTEDCTALGRLLLPSYDTAAAVNSPRRNEASRCIERMTEEAGFAEDGKMTVYVGRLEVEGS